MYLMWYDDTPKRPLAAKIADACAAYARRFGAPATVALVSEAAEAPGVTVIVTTTVRTNNVWVGRDGP